MRMRVGGADNSANSYFTSLNYVTNGAGPSRTSVQGTSGYFGIAGDLGTIVVGDISKPFSATPTVVNESYMGFATNGYESGNGGFLHNVSTSYTGFTIIPNSGNITGTIQVYGYNQ